MHLKPLSILVLAVLWSDCTAQSCSPAVNIDFKASLGIKGDVTDPTRSVNNMPVYGPRSIPAENMLMIPDSQLQMNVTVWWNSDQQLSAFASEDPGLPNGASFMPSSCYGEVRVSTLTDPYSSVCKSFLWTPNREQVGTNYSVCVVAMPTNMISCSVKKCFYVSVLAPKIVFDSLSPLDGQVFHSPVGCDLEVCVQAQDQYNRTHTDIFLTGVDQAYAAAFDSTCQPSSYPSTLNPLFPVSSAEPPSYAPGPCKKCLRWKASPGHENKNFTACFVASDADVNSILAIQRCIIVLVPKCKYCIQAGDSLHSINRRFDFSSNWLQLWNTNGMSELHPDPLSPTTAFGDPDEITATNAIIHLGPLYAIKVGEDLEHVASRFRTTVKKILQINPDISDPSAISPGQVLCLIPCSMD
ncbi:hypothetical protein GUITHDRAFT_137723 [Guillardia theta CCMP2712]|uniref:LysM domain-containing protein n=1 Tax=Guillardia theta (strain CCMP2712) TaxID=905079 RepID=L1JG89_GUITC|nr:hypothetical protein GUITHDRAFT_137723 [Guillardia theta CCMP2712]EKX47115.1 hypothetical protein GUITHDRAFT_137723 [Guillardia theta CCMP2712]|eukprot:XP_005834095.1 hypothetical protein GUITHDRAFT_137723 [Guillardia theta CCMP2712]